jgi:hypothetical protein
MEFEDNWADIVSIFMIVNFWKGTEVAKENIEISSL